MSEGRKASTNVTFYSEIFLRIATSFYLPHQFFLSISFCSLHFTHCCVCQLCFVKEKMMMMMIDGLLLSFFPRSFGHILKSQ